MYSYCVFQFMSYELPCDLFSSTVSVFDSTFKAVVFLFLESLPSTRLPGCFSLTMAFSHLSASRY